MELKDRWVLLVFLLLILFTLVFSRGEGPLGERRSVHIAPDRSAIEPVRAKAFLSEGPISNIFLTRQSSREVKEDGTAGNARSSHHSTEEMNHGD